MHDTLEMTRADALQRTDRAEQATAALYECLDRVFPTTDSKRRSAEALVSGVFARASELLILGQYPSMYVEVHALLERFTLVTVPMRLGRDSRARGLIDGMVARRTLSDLAPIAVKLDLWTEGDLRWVRRLVKLRNGLVHKNYDLLDRALGRRRERYAPQDYDYSQFTLEQTTSDFTTALDLFIQLRHRRRRGNPRK